MIATNDIQDAVEALGGRIDLANDGNLALLLPRTLERRLLRGQGLLVAELLMGAELLRPEAQPGHADLPISHTQR